MFLDHETIIKEPQFMVLYAVLELWVFFIIDLYSVIQLWGFLIHDYMTHDSDTSFRTSNARLCDAQQSNSLRMHDSMNHDSDTLNTHDYVIYDSECMKHNTQRVNFPLKVILGSKLLILDWNYGIFTDKK